MMTSWIGEGLIGRGESSSDTPAAPAEAPAVQRASRWNAHEHIFEYVGRRIGVRFPDEHTASWLQTTLEPYECADADEVHGRIDVLPSGRGNALLIDGTLTLGPYEPRDVPAALHTQIRRLALRAFDCVLCLRTGLVRRGEASALLLNQQVDGDHAFRHALEAAGVSVHLRDRLLVRQSPLRIVRQADPSAPLRIAAIVRLERAVDEERSTIAPLRRADALRRLLVEDPDVVTLFDGGSAGRFVEFFQAQECVRLTIRDVSEAARLLTEKTY